MRARATRRRARVVTTTDGPGPITFRSRFGMLADGYALAMLYTIFVILAIIALLMFIFGRRTV